MGEEIMEGLIAEADPEQVERMREQAEKRGREALAADLARKIKICIDTPRMWAEQNIWDLGDETLERRVNELRSKFFRLAAEAEEILRDVLASL